MQDQKNSTFKTLSQMVKLPSFNSANIIQNLPEITHENIAEAKSFFQSNFKHLQKISYETTLEIFGESAGSGWTDIEEIYTIGTAKVRINPIFRYALMENTSDEFIQFLITTFPEDTKKLLEDLRKVAELQNKCTQRELPENKNGLNPIYAIVRRRIIENTFSSEVVSSMSDSDKLILIQMYEDDIAKAANLAQLALIKDRIDKHPVINKKSLWERISGQERSSYYTSLMLKVLEKELPLQKIVPIPDVKEHKVLPAPSAPVAAFVSLTKEPEPGALIPQARERAEGEPEDSEEFEPGAAPLGASSAALLKVLSPGERKEAPQGEKPAAQSPLIPKHIGGPLHSVDRREEVPEKTQRPSQHVVELV